MTYPQLIAGAAPSELEWTEWVSDQVVGQYADTTDRDTEIGDNIVNGMRAVALDTGIEYIAVLDPAAGAPPYTAGDFTWMEYGRYKAWGTYTPTLDATTTTPTLGTGPTQFGRWTREGTLATVGIYLAFGTSSAAGSGIYEISLPTECPVNADWFGAQELIVGNGIAIDSSTSARSSVHIVVVAADTVRLEADTLTGQVTDSNLIAWGDGDLVLSCVVNYETEEAY